VKFTHKKKALHSREGRRNESDVNFVSSSKEKPLIIGQFA
jgi:hypothetical protein